MGEDIERMVSPVRKMAADRVYLLADEAESSVARAETVVERLASEGVETAVESVDHGTVYAILGLVTTLADRHAPDDTVRVNVSTGSRLATIGAALACMDDDTDAEAYHVPTADMETVTDRENEVSVVPDYPIESPSRDEVATMAIIATLDTDVYTPKKRDLIDEAIRLQAELDGAIPFAERIVRSADVPAGQVTGFGDIGPSQQKGAYRTFRERALAELETREYVTIDDDSVGRSDPITLTPTGEAALRAFRHKVLDVVETLDTHAAPDWLTEGLESE
ncbi:hypothetical protein DU502_07810 [Haloplanus aerogenes]|uniref:Uncharacterized protein n=1 Tax=Haloplanus aerogenes TaxID=660522 RepID=A0A3G8QU71_9EURY|nr:hypothetical protein DU502_07810 [Haloplanus aerogenes]